MCGRCHLCDARVKGKKLGSLFFFFFNFPLQLGFGFGLGFPVLFRFVLPRCHFEEVEREHQKPPADQLWSQAAGQPQSPSGAPVTGLSSHWKLQKTCIEYCNHHPTHTQPPPGGVGKNHSNPQVQRGEDLKSQGSPRPALGGSHEEGETATCKGSGGIWSGGRQLSFYDCSTPAFLPEQLQCCFPSRWLLAGISKLLQINQKCYWQLSWRVA